jgi:L-ribulose-5-phosphate 3-epimerase
MSVVLDTGNFKERMYEQMEELAGIAIMVHAKSYLGGGQWYDLEIDYSRVADILENKGFKGYISLEFEGKMDPQIAVPKGLETLKMNLA